MAIRGTGVGILALLGGGALVVAALATSPPAGQPPRTHYDSSDAASTLKTLIIRQVLFRKLHGSFTRNLTDLSFSQNSEVPVLIVEANAGGLAMIATDKATGAECAAYLGTAAAPQPYARVVNEVACKPPARTNHRP